MTKHPAFAEPITAHCRHVRPVRGPRTRSTSPRTSMRRRAERYARQVAPPRSADDLEARRRPPFLGARPPTGSWAARRRSRWRACSPPSRARALFAGGGERFGDTSRRPLLREGASGEPVRTTDATCAARRWSRSQPPTSSRTVPYPGRARGGGRHHRGGAQSIATAACWRLALLSYITPLVAGDEDYAISIVMPVNAEGLRLYPGGVRLHGHERLRVSALVAVRRGGMPPSSSTTFSCRGSRLFIYASVELVNAQFHGRPPHARELPGPRALRREAGVQPRGSP